MVNLLGINIRRLFTLIFAFGAAMAGLAGIMAGPIMGSLQPELGNPVLLGSFVVVVMERVSHNPLTVTSFGFSESRALKQEPESTMQDRGHRLFVLVKQITTVKAGM